MSTNRRQVKAARSTAREAGPAQASSGAGARMLRLARVITWQWQTADQTLKFLSPTAALTGVELMGQAIRPDRFADWMHGEDVSRVVAALVRCCDAGGFSVDFRVPHPPDSPRWWRVIGEKASADPIVDDRGQLVCLGVMQEISDYRDDAETRSRLAAIVESCEDAIISKTLDGTITSWNTGARRLFGYTPEEAIGQSIMIIIPEDRAAEERDLLRRLQQGERIEHFETVRVTKSGQRRDISVSVSPVRDASGRVVGASKVARDITREKVSQSAMLESERRMRTLTKAVNALVGSLDRNYRFRHVSSGYADWFGIPTEKIVGMHVGDIVGQELFETQGKLRIDRALAGETVQFEGRVNYARGRSRYVAATIMPDVNADGEIVGVYQFVQDLTERQAEKEALRLSEERYRSLIMTLTSVVWRADTNGNMVEPNPQWEAYTGQKWPEYAGHDWQQVLHPGDRQNVRELWQHAIDHDSFFKAEGRIWHAESQSFRFFEAAAVPVHDADANVIEWVGTVIDIHDRKTAETTARQNEQRFRHLANNISQLAWEADGSGWVYWYNERWHNYTGSSLGDLEGWGWQQVVHPDHVERVLSNTRENLSKGQPWGDTYPLRSSSGEYRWFLVHMNPMRDETGTVIRWLATHTDVTDHMELEQALKEADRRKDEFIAMLGHELRNPLSAIVNGGRVITRLADISGDERISEMCSIVSRQASHMARLVNDLLDVSRITRGKLRLAADTFNLSKRVQEIVGDFKTTLAEDAIDVTIVAPKEPIFVKADRERMGQIIGNLLHNAVKFSEGKCIVDIELQRDSSDSNAVIIVRDKGIGMDAQTLEGIFLAFEQGDQPDVVSHDGLGLGLALVKQLVEMQGGCVSAHSKGVGAGSEFVVELPQANSRSAAPSTKPAIEQSRKPVSFDILLVDDSKVVADVFSMILRDMGHEVTVAQSADRALKLLETQKPQIIISDISMPRMDGYEFARIVRSQDRFDDVMMIATTGLGLPADRRRALDAGFDEHLIKPPDNSALNALFDRARARFGK